MLFIVPGINEILHDSSSSPRSSSMSESDSESVLFMMPGVTSSNVLIFSESVASRMSVQCAVKAIKELTEKN